MQQGRLFYGEASNYPLPVPDAGSGKTRAQVINELLSESPPSAMRVCAFTLRADSPAATPTTLIRQFRICRGDT
jgi:hypothetical protein